jgi:hypothetical protein
MKLSITDAANHVPVFHEFFVIPQAIYDWFTGVIIPLPANMTQILGTAVSTPTVAGVPNVNVKTWNDLATVELPLVPTTAGRKLDVSTGGEAGVDWANVGSPTTTVGLSGTTVKTATDVETDTQDIQGRIPAALVSGRIDASVGAMAANVLTATAINADAITAAKVADGTIDAATFAASAITSTVLANDAITAAKVAADVTTELQAGLATAAALTVIDDFLDTEIAAILEDTNELQTDWVNGGRLDLLIDAIKAKTDNLPTDPADHSLVIVATDAIKADTAAILVDTNELQTDWVNGGRLDALLDSVLAKFTTARTEPAQGAPGVSVDPLEKIDWLYKAWRNKKTNDGTDTKLYADDGSTVDSKQGTSEAAGTVTKGEWVTGP